MEIKSQVPDELMGTLSELEKWTGHPREFLLMACIPLLQEIKRGESIGLSLVLFRPGNVVQHVRGIKRSV